jgi:hypothetical protein
VRDPHRHVLGAKVVLGRKPIVSGASQGEIG